MIFEAVKKNYEEAAETKGTKVLSITIFGELFGGIYPHPDVKDLCLLYAPRLKRPPIFVI